MVTSVSLAPDVLAFGNSRRGASHQRANPPVPCQDAFELRCGAVAGNSWLAVAVADGHGSKVHDRSHIGARLAVQVACDTMQGCACTVLEGYEQQEGAHIDAMWKHFATQFAADIEARWKEGVRALEQGEAAQPQESYRRYGTTLIAAMVCTGRQFFAQLGDGDVVHIDPEMQPEWISAPEDQRLVGGDTESLASSEARFRFRTTTRPAAPGAYFLVTDGLSNAFQTKEDMANFLARHYHNICRFGLEKANSIVPETLDRASSHGSGDDITLAGFIVGDLPAVSDAPRAEGEQTARDAPQDTASSGDHPPVSPRDSGEVGTPCEAQTATVNTADPSAGESVPHQTPDSPPEQVSTREQEPPGDNVHHE